MITYTNQAIYNPNDISSAFVVYNQASQAGLIPRFVQETLRELCDPIARCLHNFSAFVGQPEMEQAAVTQLTREIAIPDYNTGLTNIMNRITALVTSLNTSPISLTARAVSLNTSPISLAAQAAGGDVAWVESGLEGGDIEIAPGAAGGGAAATRQAEIACPEIEFVGSGLFPYIFANQALLDIFRTFHTTIDGFSNPMMLLAQHPIFKEYMRCHPNEEQILSDHMRDHPIPSEIRHQVALYVFCFMLHDITTPAFSACTQRPINVTTRHFYSQPHESHLNMENNDDTFDENGEERRRENSNSTRTMANLYQDHINRTEPYDVIQEGGASRGNLLLGNRATPITQYGTTTVLFYHPDHPWGSHNELSLHLHPFDDNSSTHSLPCIIEIMRAIKIITDTFTNSPNDVLVACREGKSRSAAIMCGYLMQTQQLSFESALRQVFSIRPVVKTHFLTPLIALEALFAVTNPVCKAGIARTQRAAALRAQEAVSFKDQAVKEVAQVDAQIKRRLQEEKDQQRCVIA